MTLELAYPTLAERLATWHKLIRTRSLGPNGTLPVTLQAEETLVLLGVINEAAFALKGD